MEPPSSKQVRQFSLFENEEDATDPVADESISAVNDTESTA